MIWSLDIDEDVIQYIGSDEQAYISLMHILAL